MIDRKIVLVLGAGASMPFGFPSGPQLKTQIIHGLQPGVNRKMFSQVRDAGFAPEKIEAFRSALQKSGKRSVDAFLEHRPEYLKVGKTATASALLPCENEENLFDGGKENWYEYLFNKLNARFEEFEQNRLSVLTFNYDRSLEYYLMTALRNAYGKNPEECAEKLRCIPIVHLYGQLGDLPFMGERVIPFGGAEGAKALTRSADGIQIIHEDVSGARQFEQAHELLKQSERICFIGFGYDRVNLDRLLSAGAAGGQQVSGSAKGLTPTECVFIKEAISTYGFRAVTLEYLFGEALEFMHHKCPFD